MGKNIRDIIKKTLITEMKKPHLIKENEDLMKIRDIKNSIEKKLKKVYLDVTGEELNLPKSILR
jgi:hypothetical protein